VAPSTRQQCKGVFITTQLNSTQLNSTDPVEQCTAKSVVFLFMTSRPTNWVNWVTTFVDRLLFTLWTCRQLDVELSCIGVAIHTSLTQLNSTRRRVVNTFPVWTTVTYQWTYMLWPVCLPVRLSVCHTHIVYYNKMAEHAMSNHVHHVVALPHCFSRTKFTRDERATNIISRSKVTENEHRTSQHNTCNNVTHGATSSSAIEERPCNASCLSAVSFNSIIHWVQSSVTSYFCFRFIAACN